VSVSAGSDSGQLLGVDLGLRTGLACYGRDGRLQWYRSHNLGERRRLKRAAYHILGEIPDLAWLIAEGDRGLFEIWAHEAQRRGVSARNVPAETWRRALLYRRGRRSGRVAKQHADRIARAVIEWSGASRPTSLRHDAAEAILIGLWGVLELGWVATLPDPIAAAR
jgi:hypothetical protein